MRTTISEDSFFNGIRKRIDAAIDDVLDAVETAALEFVRNARMTNTYKDQTGNLRSSIGYIIYRDGAAVRRNFEASPGEGTETGDVGRAEAERYAETVQPGMGISVVVVAGMDYAKYVEAKGKDVITNSKELMVHDIPMKIKIVLADG